MKQNNLLLLSLLVLSPVNVQASASKSGSGFSISMGSAGGQAAPAVRTSHDLNLDLKALGEAFSKFQVGLSPEMADQFKKITDPKTLGELLEKFKVIPQNLTVGMDYKKLGEALASVKINIDEKALRELMGSKEVQEAIKNLKLVDQVRITVPEIPRVPVDVSVNLSAENGRRIAATTGATMSTISIALQGAGFSNCCLLAGSCIAVDPTAAYNAARMVCSEQNRTRVKNCCVATKNYCDENFDHCCAQIRKKRLKLSQKFVQKPDQASMEKNS